MKLRWFLSGKLRQATDMCKHVQKLLDAQRDLMPPPALEAVSTALAETRAAVAAGTKGEELEKQMKKLETVADKWIKPYPYSEWRENIEVFLVAIAVAMAIRTFFLQPFKIPTGSMEPTLFGIETTDLQDKPDFKRPGGLERIWDLMVHGTTYHQFIAEQDGHFVSMGPLEHYLIFMNKQTIWVQYDGQEQEAPLVLHGGPDGRMDRPGHFAGLEDGYIRRVFKKGEPILSIKEETGDHLFVDRLTYNFRRPERGEIVVFKTKGIMGIRDQDQFYIKRLMGLPGETISIGEDQHARINGKRLDASTPHYQNVYGFDPNAPRREGRYGQYNGHVLVANSLLETTNSTIDVGPHEFIVFGDNTLNSFDSRYWGYVPQNNVIGKAFFVYWPFSPRFGCGQK